MRQAGRYLPAYRKVREGTTFWEMCKDIDRAVEVSLQPLAEVGSEAVILFSDIFSPIPGMGIDVDFAPGPVIADPIRTAAQVDRLHVPDPTDKAGFVFDILGTLRKELEPRQIPLLGFAGAPFTLAAYLVEGQGSRHFSTLKRMMLQSPKILRSLLARLTDLTVDYLNAQVAAGAQAVQLFDTWAGLLSEAEYRAWVLPVHQEIAGRISRDDAPLILYVNNGAHVFEAMLESDADVLSLDWRVDIARAARLTRGEVSLQGNLDPCALAAPPAEIAARVRRIAHSAAPARGHILNLGHGCLPETPVEGVRAFTEAARAVDLND